MRAVTRLSITSCGIRGEDRGVGKRQIASGPGSDNTACIAGVPGIGKKVVGRIEGDETLGVRSGTVNGGGVFNPHHLVAWRMHHQKRRLEPMQCLGWLPGLQIIKQALADGEIAAADADGGLAGLLDLFRRLLRAAL